MPDIMMIFKYLHNQFGCFNRNNQAACLAKFMGFKNRLSRAGTDVAAQKIRKNRLSFSVPVNQAQVADAGGNQTVTVGDIVTLDYSGSSDADSDALTFSWSLTTFPAIARQC
jgi:hypothetical protein